MLKWDKKFKDFINRNFWVGKKGRRESWGGIINCSQSGMLRKATERTWIQSCPKSPRNWPAFVSLCQLVMDWRQSCKQDLGSDATVDFRVSGQSTWSIIPCSLRCAKAHSHSWHLSWDLMAVMIQLRLEQQLNMVSSDKYWIRRRTAGTKSTFFLIIQK